MNLRPSGYEPDELPGCSTPRRYVPFLLSVRFGTDAFLRSVLLSFLRGLSLFRSGGDLLSHVLRRSTIGVGALIGRVRDGIGSFTPAMTTRPEKRPGRAFALPKHQCCSRFSSRVFLRAFDDPWSGLLSQYRTEQGLYALLLPDQIKPIGQLVPVS